MRAPNGQTCLIIESKYSSVIVAGDILWRCKEFFERSTRTGIPVVFEFLDEELMQFERFYPNLKNDAVRVKEFLNSVILMQMKMPYEVSTVLHLVWTGGFSCRMVHELPIYD
jgi:hypothetical protein